METMKDNARKCGAMIRKELKKRNIVTEYVKGETIGFDGRSRVFVKVKFLDIKDLINLDVERARLDKEIFRWEGQLKGVRSKLNNSSFLQKAPAEVVEHEKQKLTDMETSLNKIKRNRENLE